MTPTTTARLRKHTCLLLNTHINTSKSAPAHCEHTPARAHTQLTQVTQTPQLTPRRLRQAHYLSLFHIENVCAHRDCTSPANCHTRAPRCLNHVHTVCAPSPHLQASRHQFSVISTHSSSTFKPQRRHRPRRSVPQGSTSASASAPCALCGCRLCAPGRPRAGMLCALLAD